MNREIKIVFAYFIVLATLFFGVTMAFADCTGFDEPSSLSYRKETQTRYDNERRTQGVFI